MSTAAAMSPTSRFRRYPAYKDSGVEWLGVIPAHWEAVPNAALFLERNERGRDNLPILEVSIASGVRIREFSATKIEQRSDDLRSYRVAKTGDIAFNKMRMWQGAVGASPEDGLVSPDYIVASPRKAAVPEYFAAVFRTPLYMAEVYRWSHGIVDDRNRLYWDDFKAIRTPCPPTSEQRAIAAFLHRETARIDALVAKKERLIELLQEQRIALITRAVTKGLDSNVPMKDSGVEWLGEIPAHWEVAPVYARYEVALGKMLDTKRVTGEFPGRYLRNIDVQWDTVNTQDLPEMDFAPWERDRYLVRLGDLLVCEGGEVGRTAIWRGEIDECFYQKALHRVRPRLEREVPRFFYYLMSMVAARGVFAAVGNQNTIDHLTGVQLKHYRFPFAPAREQEATAAFLDRETVRIDALVAKVRDAIDRLRELRTALISAAVTGKIDVRGEAA